MPSMLLRCYNLQIYSKIDFKYQRMCYFQCPHSTTYILEKQNCYANLSNLVLLFRFYNLIYEYVDIYLKDNKKNSDPIQCSFAMELLKKTHYKCEIRISFHPVLLAVHGGIN